MPDSSPSTSGTAATLAVLEAVVTDLIEAGYGTWEAQRVTYNDVAALIARARRADELEAERDEYRAIAEWVADHGPKPSGCGWCAHRHDEEHIADGSCVWVRANRVLGR